MSETTENTLSAYLGPEFQLKLIWQLLVEPEFAERVIPDIAVEYFDDPNIKRLFLIMLEYIRAFEKVPNLQNQSINQAINQFKTPNNVIEEESLFAVVEKIKLWNERVLNKELQHDGDVIQTSTYTFIKQQEYRKLGEFTITSTKNGEIRKKHTIVTIEEKFQKIANIGDIEDNGTDVTENIGNALRKEFRQTIPTGVDVIDQLTGGGLGKGEIGLILTPSGVGKTTLLTKIANTARELSYNVLQIIFEDTVEQIQRKHFTIWTGVPLSQIDDKLEYVTEQTNNHINNVLRPGRLTIKKMSQEDTTMKDVRNWIIREQKKNGFKYDIVIIDYLDCLESHKKTADRNEAELVIVKSFEAMASDLNIPCWSAIQSNRTGFGAEFVEAQQTGGNIKRIQKAHFFMSVAKTPSQQEASLANIKILKARFAKDGQMFTDCIFNNDTMQIIIRDDRYVKTTGIKKISEETIEKFESNNANLMHVAASNAEPMTEADIDDALGNKTVGEVIPITQTVLMPVLQTVPEFQPEYTETFELDLEGGVIEKVDDVNEEISEGAVDITSTVHETVSDAVKRGLVPVFNPLLREASNPIVERHIDKSVDIPPFEWTGKTETVKEEEIEIKLEDLPSGGQNLVEPVVIQPAEIAPKIEKTPEIQEKIDVKKVQEKLLINPDDPILSQKNMISYLMNKRSNEVINKKE
jgi:replicative DNA helicase